MQVLQAISQALQEAMPMVSSRALPQLWRRCRSKRILEEGMLSAIKSSV